MQKDFREGFAVYSAWTLIHPFKDLLNYLLIPHRNHYCQRRVQQMSLCGLIIFYIKFDFNLPDGKQVYLGHAHPENTQVLTYFRIHHQMEPFTYLVTHRTMPLVPDQNKSRITFYQPTRTSDCTSSKTYISSERNP